MTPEELKRLFERCVEAAEFHNQNRTEALDILFIYACESGMIWKFTPKNWFAFVTKAVRSGGRHDSFLSQALLRRPSYINKGKDNHFYSCDLRMRCVNPVDWTLQDWTNELIPYEKRRAPPFRRL